MTVHLHFLGSVNTANEVSIHPPHLIDSSGSLTPTALIPFCAYQTNATLLGQNRQDLPYTVCTHFQPTVLDGQRCYSLNLTSIYKGKTKIGKAAGLVIIIDTGVQNTNRTQSEDSNENPFDLESSDVDSGSARIYLNTLSSFTDYRAGSYDLTVLKKMNGTEGYLKQTDGEKKCRMEPLYIYLYIYICIYIKTSRNMPKVAIRPWTRGI